jgi:exosortase E/protease (VPEID-CTERM system)
LFFILIAEAVVLTSYFDAPDFIPQDPSSTGYIHWASWFFYTSRWAWQPGLWIIAAVFLLVVVPNHRIFGVFTNHHGWKGSCFLATHFLVFAVFAFTTALIFQQPCDPARLTPGWLAGWLVLLGGTVTFWCLALAPGRFWLTLIVQERFGLGLAVLLGICAWQLIRFDGPLASPELWASLATPTLHMVHSLLGWFYSDLIFEPENYVVGPDAFAVEIRYGCSGIEGIILISIFIAMYCWIFRRDLRFPHVFLLFPLGILAIWLANGLRVTLLIVIGEKISEDIALKGFHAQAGWVALALVALALIALAHRLRIFSKAQPGTWAIPRPALALLVPLLALLATSMVTSLFSDGFNLLYSLHIVVVGGVLLYFRKEYANLGWRWSWEGPAIGIGVFVLWYLLHPEGEGDASAIEGGLTRLPDWAAAGWLALRIVGSVLIVPLAEELAFRAYLMRKLISKDFETVPIGQFSWFSFLISSVLFGLMHQSWLAGTLAGMAYGLAVCWRRRFSDAVVAHMTTNALIALAVVVQGRWFLWS